MSSKPKSEKSEKYQEMQKERAAHPPLTDAANPFDDDATPAVPGAGHEYRHLSGGIWKCERCGFQAVGTADAPPTHPFQAGCFVPAVAGPVKTP